jgi:hypothetical protein
VKIHPKQSIHQLKKIAMPSAEIAVCVSGEVIIGDR